MSGKINRLKKIEYQIKKNYSAAAWEDDEYVRVAQGILNEQIDGDDVILDSEMPTTMLGVTLDWSAGTDNDAIVELTKGASSITQDLTEDNVTVDDV